MWALRDDVTYGNSSGNRRQYWAKMVTVITSDLFENGNNRNKKYYNKKLKQRLSFGCRHVLLTSCSFGLRCRCCCCCCLTHEYFFLQKNSFWRASVTFSWKLLLLVYVVCIVCKYSVAQKERKQDRESSAEREKIRTNLFLANKIKIKPEIVFITKI